MSGLGWGWGDSVRLGLGLGDSVRFIFVFFFKLGVICTRFLIHVCPYLTSSSDYSDVISFPASSHLLKLNSS